MFARKTYTPTRNRQIKDGKIDVSREELEDFQRQFGKHLTLRDLLNYDRTQRLPAAPKSTDDQRARGTQEANIRPKSEDDPRARGTQEANIRPNGGADTGPAGPRRDKAAEAKGAETLERMKARAERDPGRLKAAGLAPDSTTLEQSLVAAAGMAAPKGAQMLGRGLLSVLERRAAAEGAKRVAEEASRRDPDLGLPPQGSVFRSNRPPKDDIPTLRDAVEYKKGGTTKAYAKGGSVKGSGCEQRGLRKCKVY